MVSKSSAFKLLIWLMMINMTITMNFDFDAKMDDMNHYREFIIQSQQRRIYYFRPDTRKPDGYFQFTRDSQVINNRGKILFTSVYQIEKGPEPAFDAIIERAAVKLQLRHKLLPHIINKIEMIMPRHELAPEFQLLKQRAEKIDINVKLSFVVDNLHQTKITLQGKMTFHNDCVWYKKGQLLWKLKPLFGQDYNNIYGKQQRFNIWQLSLTAAAQPQKINYEQIIVHYQSKALTEFLDIEKTMHLKSKVRARSRFKVSAFPKGRSDTLKNRIKQHVMKNPKL